MSKESEVTEFEQERMQHPTGHCEDCGCPLEVCCKPKKPVVEVEWLNYIIERKKYMESPLVGKQEWVINVENLLSIIKKQSQVTKK